MTDEWIFTMSCLDRVGIVACVGQTLAENDCSITESHQFLDEASGRFFMRVRFRSNQVGLNHVQTGLHELGLPEERIWRITPAEKSSRLLVMISKEGHCLNDLIYRCRIGAIPATIEAVVSNHRDLEPLVAAAGLPFHHVPVSRDNKRQAERQLVELIHDRNIDLVVLARYMQILSEELCDDLRGMAINIHHSLLPSFKGAKPYAQAYERGVKVVGATAHYVTADLDEGPIITQDFEGVDHAHTARRLASIGRDLEARALSKAVLAHCENRVMLDGNGRTVVFT